MSRPFQFSLQWPFVFLAGMMAGGQTARGIALGETPMRGGVPVSWSTRGEATFFSIGCLAALGGMAIVAGAPMALRIRAPWHGRKNIRRMCALFIGALIIGSLSAGAAFMALAIVFFAMPQEIFDFLTTHQ
jgi:hypothetical protein